MATIARLLGAVALCLAATSSAYPDTVTLAGSSIPLRSCVILDLKSGRVYFRDGGGRRQRREIEDVVALGFTGLPALDEAERRLAEGDDTGGLTKLLGALLDADHPAARLWIRARLATVHDERGECVQAAGHAAVVFMQRQESFWQRLEPTSAVNRPPFAAVAETMLLLEEARRTLDNRDLKRIVERLIRKIRPLHESLASSYKGPEIAPRTTRSGFSIESIRAGSPQTPGTHSGSTAPPSRVEPVGVGTPATAGARAAPDAPETIDTALETGRSAAALSICEHVARRPGARELDRFLHQYGRALAAEGRRRDAAVMFMRCAVLYESSPYAAPSLLNAATICRDEFANEDAARRLAERALEMASSRGEDAVATRARGILATLSRGKNR